MIYQTNLPNGHNGLQKIGEHFENLKAKSPNQTPVIVVLNPKAILRLLNEYPVGFNLNFSRYSKLKKELDAVNYFELPIIQLTHDDKIVFVDGRHRTYYMESININAVPYLTMNGMASGLKALAGTNTTPINFDLQTTIYPIM